MGKFPHLVNLVLKNPGNRTITLITQRNDGEKMFNALHFIFSFSINIQQTTLSSKHGTNCILMNKVPVLFVGSFDGILQQCGADFLWDVTAVPVIAENID